MHRVRRRQITALLAGALLTAGVAFAAPASAATTTLVTNARWGGHCTYDRLVIDLQGAAPPVTVTPVSQLVYDGSGKPVPLPGKYFLEIRLHPAAGHDDTGRNVYVGPKLQQIALSKLKGMAMTGDFEGYVTFGAAFDTPPAYNTSVLHAPERFVLDFPHPATC
ncbi:AMIN-like domain-containing (lipo)protein [Streptomyces sp. NPDC054838]